MVTAPALTEYQSISTKLRMSFLDLVLRQDQIGTPLLVKAWMRTPPHESKPEIDPRVSIFVKWYLKYPLFPCVTLFLRAFSLADNGAIVHFADLVPCATLTVGAMGT